jgi:hypothetical protein
MSRREKPGLRTSQLLPRDSWRSSNQNEVHVRNSTHALRTKGEITSIFKPIEDSSLLFAAPRVVNGEHDRTNVLKGYEPSRHARDSTFMHSVPRISTGASSAKIDQKVVAKAIHRDVHLISVQTQRNSWERPELMRLYHRQKIWIQSSLKECLPDVHKFLNQIAEFVLQDFSLFISQISSRCMALHGQKRDFFLMLCDRGLHAQVFGKSVDEFSLKIYRKEWQTFVKSWLRDLLVVNNCDLLLIDVFDVYIDYLKTIIV